jgi:hypothetical protein
VHPRDPGRVRGEELRREVAEGRDHARLDQIHLLLEPRPARVDLLRLRVAVAGRAALEDVRDEDVVAVHPDLAEELVQELPGAADERHPLAVLLGSGRLADEHQVGVGVARPEDDGVAPDRERALLARRRLAVDLDEALAALRRARLGRDSLGRRRLHLSHGRPRVPAAPRRESP